MQRGGYDNRNRGRGGGRGGRGGVPGGRIIFGSSPAILDPRLADASQDELLGGFKTLTIAEPARLPLRPGWGTIGTPITLRANFFAMKVPKGPFYEYEVKMEPKIEVKRVRKRIFQLLQESPPFAPYRNKVAHDSTTRLIAAVLLGHQAKVGQRIEIEVTLRDEDEPQQRQGAPPPKKFKVIVIYKGEIDMSNLSSHLAGDPQYRTYDTLPVISALNIILGQHPQGRGVSVGRNRYFFPYDNVDIGGGLEAWKGFYSSVRPSFKQLHVNVNVATTAFYKAGNLADALQAVGQRNASRFFEGVRIQTKHLGYTKKYTIFKLGRNTPRSEMFDCEALGGRVSVEDFFKRTYRITLRQTHLPVINVGSKSKNIYLPAEICQIIPQQPFRGKLTDDHTAQMIRHACRPPAANAEAITASGLQYLGFAPPQSPPSEFGINIGSEMAVVPGRILSPPRLQYAQNTPTVQGASWNLKGVKFSVGAPLGSWAVLVLQDGPPESNPPPDQQFVRSCIDEFIQMCQNSGMVDTKKPPQIALVPRFPPTRDDVTRPEAIQLMRETMMTKFRPKPSIILVILANGDKHVYSGLKHLCDTQLDVATVCVHASKFLKPRNLQYHANIALKFNMKKGGVNHTLSPEALTWLNKVPTALFGADVTHAGPGSLKGTPSIAAVVGSIDNKYGQYPASLRLQEYRKEMITDLTDMMVERLNEYKRRSNRLPERIIFFRDGVSEGQFLTVVEDEVPKMIASFQKFRDGNKPYRPKLAVAICGKRHHTRFYPTKEADADNLGNPKPGTVVDRGVTEVFGFDFFLQAHAGLQGTTRPTHYTIVYDEIRFSADDIHTLTHNACYLFARATKAVSLVPPAYYADIACERGRCYIHRLLHATDTATAASRSSGDDVQQVAAKARELWGNGVGNALKETMFYL